MRSLHSYDIDNPSTLRQPCPVLQINESHDSPIALGADTCTVEMALWIMRATITAVLSLTFEQRLIRLDVPVQRREKHVP